MNLVFSLFSFKNYLQHDFFWMILKTFWVPAQVIYIISERKIGTKIHLIFHHNSLRLVGTQLETSLLEFFHKSGAVTANSATHTHSDLSFDKRHKGLVASFGVLAFGIGFNQDVIVNNWTVATNHSAFWLFNLKHYELVE